MNTTVIIGSTNWRQQQLQFGINEEDRFNHIYCLGKTGVGKSTLLLNMAIADIQSGNAIGIIDPHGDVAEKILQYVPANRTNDVVYFNPSDSDYPIGFNPLAVSNVKHHHLVVSSLLSSFRKLWIESWGPRLEYILRYCLLTLLEYPRATLLDIQLLLTDYVFRQNVLQFVKSEHTRNFWFLEFDKYPPNFKQESISPILNKTGVFLSNPILRNIVGQSETKFDLQPLMNEGKIVICNLAKGMLGEDIASLLGSMIITSIQLAALSRASIPEPQRKPFFVYVDEMHSYIPLSLIGMLSEVRKYKVGLFLTHQYIEQLSPEFQAAVFGNVGTLISFRVGNKDAEIMAKEFYPVFDQSDIVNLPKYSIYLKLMIDGATSKPFSAATFPLPEITSDTSSLIKMVSRQTFGQSKQVVEETIHRRMRRVSNSQHIQATLF